MNAYDVKIINNSVQFQDVFSRTIIALIDFHRHVVCLDNLLEDFDESVENYNFEIWNSLGQSKIQEQSLIEETHSSIRKASDMGMKLEQEIQIACQDLLRLFLNCSQERQEELLGFAIPLSTHQVEQLISASFELLIDEWIYLSPEELEERLQTEEPMVSSILDEYSCQCKLFLSCLRSKETIRMAGLSD